MPDTFLGDLWLALLRAADGDCERAQAALNYLRNEVPRGQGQEPGHRGWCYLPTDKAAMHERHRLIIELHEYGYRDAEIAEAVCLAEGTVRNFLSRRRRR